MNRRNAQWERIPPILYELVKNVRWKEFLLAFAMALTLWFAVSGTENVESQVDVRLEYKGIPKNLLLQSPGLINKVSVRLSGPAGQIRAMSGRDYVFTMDLSSLTTGENSLPVNIAGTGLFGGLKVIEVTPPKILLTAEAVYSKDVPLKAEIRAALTAGLHAEALLIPEKVTIRGLTQEVEKVQEIIVPLAVGRVNEPGNRDLNTPLSLPSGLEASPASVDAVVRVDWKRKEVRLRRNIEADVPSSLKLSAQPATVRILAALPEALAPEAADNPDIRASVIPVKLEPGAYRLPVRISLPTGALLLTMEPEDVSVTLEKAE